MYKVIIDYEPIQADNDIISEGIYTSHKNIIGEKDKDFSIFLKNNSGKVLSGIQAYFDAESIYIAKLWVEESLRKQGYGTTLLDQAEGAGVKYGCIFSIVDTWDFQAESFYSSNEKPRGLPRGCR
jgi:GNAT superfamily N-acetyltransferase